MTPAIRSASGAQLVIGNEPITIRPLLAADAPLDADFVRHLSADARRLRFFCGVKELSAEELKLLCGLDGQDSMAFVATTQTSGRETAIGVSRYAPSLNKGGKEMALAIADDWQDKGLAEILMSRLIEYARSHGVKRLYSVELADNHMMRKLSHALGLEAKQDPDDGSQVIYSLDL